MHTYTDYLVIIKFSKMLLNTFSTFATQRSKVICNPNEKFFHTKL